MASPSKRPYIQHFKFVNDVSIYVPHCVPFVIRLWIYYLVRMLQCSLVSFTVRIEFMTRYTIYLKLCFTAQFVTLQIMLVALYMNNNQLFYCVGKYFV